MDTNDVFKWCFSAFVYGCVGEFLKALSEKLITRSVKHFKFKKAENDNEMFRGPTEEELGNRILPTYLGKIN